MRPILKGSPKREEGNGGNQLFEVIDQHPFLLKQKEVLQKALLGKYVSASEMKSDFVHLLSNETSKAGVRKKTNKTQKTSSNNAKRQQIRYSHAQTNQSRKQAKKSKKRKKTSGILETILILVGVFLIYSLYVYHFLM